MTHPPLYLRAHIYIRAEFIIHSANERAHNSSVYISRAQAIRERIESALNQEQVEEGVCDVKGVEKENDFLWVGHTRAGNDTACIKI